VVCGVWCVVCGVWCVVCGVWCVVCGVIPGSYCSSDASITRCHCEPPERHRRKTRGVVPSNTVETRAGRLPFPNARGQTPQC